MHSSNPANSLCVRLLRGLTLFPQKNLKSCYPVTVLQSNFLTVSDRQKSGYLMSKIFNGKSKRNRVSPYRLHLVNTQKKGGSRYCRLFLLNIFKKQLPFVSNYFHCLNDLLLRESDKVGYFRKRKIFLQNPENHVLRFAKQFFKLLLHKFIINS